MKNESHHVELWSDAHLSRNGANRYWWFRTHNTFYLPSYLQNKFHEIKIFMPHIVICFIFLIMSRSNRFVTIRSSTYIVLVINNCSNHHGHLLMHDVSAKKETPDLIHVWWFFQPITPFCDIIKRCADDVRVSMHKLTVILFLGISRQNIVKQMRWLCQSVNAQANCDSVSWK